MTNDINLSARRVSLQKPAAEDYASSARRATAA